MQFDWKNDFSDAINDAGWVSIKDSKYYATA